MDARKERFFYSSTKVDVQVDPQTFETLPAKVKEAIIQKFQQDKTEDPTIKMLREQLQDDKLPKEFKDQLEEMLNKLEQNNSSNCSRLC